MEATCERCGKPVKHQDDLIKSIQDEWFCDKCWDDFDAEADRVRQEDEERETMRAGERRREEGS